MAAHIPFVNTQRDCDVVKRHYGDSQVIRISLGSVSDVKGRLGGNMDLWIDPAIDAYHLILTTNWPVRILELSPREIKEAWPVDEEGKKKETMKLRTWENWYRVFGKFEGHRVLGSSKLWKKEHVGELVKFVEDVLNECLQHDPAWVTVPQLPLTDKKERQKVNTQLAEATSNWKSTVGFRGKLILPVIFTNQRQLNQKPIRDDKLNHAIDCYKKVGADGVWIVDSTLLDQNRSESFGKRYSKLIEFHSLAKAMFPKGTLVIAGPYWGMGLLLWARDLCDFPAVSLGTSYAYYISCGATKQGRVRLAIPPLRRWAVAQGLRGWLRDCARRLSPTDPFQRDFAYLLEKFDLLRDRDAAAMQIAEFQKKWFEKIETVPQAGRALALYQDLSAAFVLGRQLPLLPQSTLPNSPSTILEAGKVAEQLMLKCL